MFQFAGGSGVPTNLNGLGDANTDKIVDAESKISYGTLKNEADMNTDAMGINTQSRRRGHCCTLM